MKPRIFAFYEKEFQKLVNREWPADHDSVMRQLCTEFIHTVITLS